MPGHTVVHVTHEAIHKIGGIGAVLHGLLTSREYLNTVRRNVLVGPYWPTERTGEGRLGSEGEVLYSSIDGINRTPLAAQFREIETKFNVRFIYGRRRFTDRDTGITSVPEVLLIDVSTYDASAIGLFKFRLWEKFELDSAKYENIWDFEQWMRLAEPAVAAMHAIGATTAHDPAIILSHEYMGMPTCLAAILEGEQSRFRTVFHAHEVATMRRIVESRSGHDTLFYNAMKLAMPAGHYVDDVFGPQDDYYKHALVGCARFCDEIFGVGDYVLKELRFMGEAFASIDASLAYNGVPSFNIDAQAKLASRAKLQQYCQNLLGYKPDFVMTHVTRLVPSKGLWRDLRVLEKFEKHLRDANETAVLFVLSVEGQPRRPEDVRRMEAEHDWPVSHREGHPDLSGGEAAFYNGVQGFNARSRNAKVVYLNQFGFTRKMCGQRMPIEMEFMDIRKGSDAEFGQSIYEPFGIAQVEPISFGGICVYTNICGCAGFVHKAAGEQLTPNALVADYTRLPEHLLKPERVLAIGKAERDEVEQLESARVAQELFKRLPRTPAEFEPFIARGQELANRMSWDVVARDYVLPGFNRAAKQGKLSAIA